MVIFEAFSRDFAEPDYLVMPASILITEDYDDNRELLRVLLSGAAYDVREAKNGLECLSMAKEQPPDLIIVDL